MTHKHKVHTSVILTARPDKSILVLTVLTEVLTVLHHSVPSWLLNGVYQAQAQGSKVSEVTWTSPEKQHKRPRGDSE